MREAAILVSVQLIFIYYSLLSLFAICFAPKFKKLGIKFFLCAFILVSFVYLFKHSGIRDIELLESVGNYSLLRLDVYYFDANHQLYPYFPFLSPILGITLFVSIVIHMQFLTLWRVLMILTLFALAHLIRKILTIQNKKNVDEKIILFLFSPLSLFAVAYHAHPDVLLIFFYLASIYLVLLKKERQILGAFFFGLSILTKTWSIFFFIPILVSKLRFVDKFKFSAISGLTIIFVTLFYIRFWHSNIFRIFDAVGGYGGSWVVLWGPQGLFTLIFGNTHFFPSYLRSIWLFFLLIPLYFLIFLKKVEIIKASELIMLTIFVFTVSWATQYAFWVWPFIILCEKTKNIKIMSFFSLPFVLVSYVSFVNELKIDWLIVFSSLPLWSFGAWLWYTSIRKIAK